mgnify:CR=1 FL=1
MTAVVGSMAVVQGGVGVVPPLQRAVEAIAVEVERISEGQRFVTQRNAAQFFRSAEPLQRPMYTQQRLSPRDGSQHGQRDQSQVEQHVAVFDIEQTESTLPRSNELIVSQVRIIFSVENVTLVGKHDR